MTSAEANATQLVFSEEDYHKLYSDPYSWANLTQLSLLLDHTCLFVGVSLTDPNLRRLLDVCATLGRTHRHYAIVLSPAYAAAEAEMPLAKQIKAAIEADFTSLNVVPIWVRRYEEISDIFKAIRVARVTRDSSVAVPSAAGRTAPQRRRRKSQDQ